MKRNSICFTIHSLGYGGAKTSLINLVNQIDEAIDVDIYVLHEVLFDSSLFKRNVNIVSPTKRMLFIDGIKNAKSFFRYFSLIVLLRFVFVKLILFLKSFNNKKITQYYKDQLKWKHIWKKSIKKTKKAYDVSVGYMDGLSSYFAIDVINSNKTILWSHHEYSDFNANLKLDEFYYNIADHIIFVSNTCKNVFMNTFPQIDDSKLSVIPNLMDVDDIREKASDYYPPEFLNENRIKIISIGRLNPIKHFDLIVEISKYIKREFLWLIIGEGGEYKKLSKLIEEVKKEDSIKLIGSKDNPYPYYANADLFVQTSFSEAKSIVIDEAKLFGLPILCNNYPTANEAAEKYDSFTICSSPEEFAKAIDNYIPDEKLHTVRETVFEKSPIDFLIGVIKNI